MRKILIATGGTGGHLFPARQLSELLTDSEVVFAGHKLEQTPFFDRKVPYVEITSSAKKTNLWAHLKGLWQSLRLILRFKPDVVVGFGSFYSFPVVLAAVLLRKKLILFEANCSIGIVNKWFAPFADALALQFPLPEKKAVYVPLLPWVGKQKELIAPQEARRRYGLDPDLFTILVFGGSQGAVFINKTFCQAAALLHQRGCRFQVIHLTGKEDPEIRYAGKAVVKPFEREMSLAYSAADLVVSRCGAGTTAELIRFRKPAIVIPYPYAYDHQRHNGLFLQGGACVLLQTETTPERLADEIETMRGQLAKRRQALAEIVLPKTVDFGALVRQIGGKR